MSDIRPIKNTHTQLLVNERLEICSLLLDQFKSVFTSPITNMIVRGQVSFLSCQSLNPDECLTEIEISEQAPALKLMFSQSLNQSTITPVFKSGTKSSPSNYRPISLTSTIIKVFERIIRKKVVAFFTSQDHLNNTHHGFRSGRSCVSVLLDVFDDLMHMLSSDTTVDMIYLDFSKAFDKVYHGILLHKLKDVGITGKLGIWFFQFLTNRTHYVRISKKYPSFEWCSTGHSPGATTIHINDI